MHFVSTSLWSLNHNQVLLQIYFKEKPCFPKSVNQFLTGLFLAQLSTMFSSCSYKICTSSILRALYSPTNTYLLPPLRPSHTRPGCVSFSDFFFLNYFYYPCVTSFPTSQGPCKTKYWSYTVKQTESPPFKVSSGFFWIIQMFSFVSSLWPPPCKPAWWKSSDGAGPAASIPMGSSLAK